MNYNYSLVKESRPVQTSLCHHDLTSVFSMEHELFILWCSKSRKSSVTHGRGGESPEDLTRRPQHNGGVFSLFNNVLKIKHKPKRCSVLSDLPLRYVRCSPRAPASVYVCEFRCVRARVWLTDCVSQRSGRVRPQHSQLILDSSGAVYVLSVTVRARPRGAYYGLLERAVTRVNS